MVAGAKCFQEWFGVAAWSHFVAVLRVGRAVIGNGMGAALLRTAHGITGEAEAEGAIFTVRANAVGD